MTRAASPASSSTSIAKGEACPATGSAPPSDDLSTVCSKLYAKGFRNPFRFQLRAGAGPLVGDVGWNTEEELDVTQAGRSYGWPCYEGSGRTPSYQDLPSCAAQYDAGPSAHQPPAYEYPHSGSDAAIVAGPRYEADRYPVAYRGAWFFGDYAKGLIWRMTIDDAGPDLGRHAVRLGLRGRRRPRTCAQRRSGLPELRR